jgi:outer membrane protein OmpA-like peptidoglycan-associated protein/tetratricopeptide (TPR) repeat protein
MPCLYVNINKNALMQIINIISVFFLLDQKESKNHTIFKTHISLLCVIFVFLFPVKSAYSQKYKKLIEIADKAAEEKDFFTAAQYYNQAILKDSSDINLQYKYAEASRENYDLDIALRWYNKVLKQDNQGVQFPECVFWIASLKKINGNYKEAKSLFNKYIQKNKKNKNSYYVKKAYQEIAACDQAQWLISHPDENIKIIHLDTAVNSTVSEYAPFQADSILYFSSLRNGNDKDPKLSNNYNKIFSSTQQGETWEKATELDSVFNQKNTHNANTAFNKEFKRVYITRCDEKNNQEYNCKIYSSELKNNSWTPFSELPSEINLPGANNTHPAIGYLGNQEVLFFSSNRAGGEGGMDIWYSKIGKNNTYETPVNAGKNINSIEDEITPYYCNPCQELFFSSTWHKGLGGFDIFKSEYKNNTFEEPHNLGLPINSSYNDIYFSINKSQTQAFLSSNRKGSYFEKKESCCNDIYMFKIPGTETDTTTVADSTMLVNTTDSINTYTNQLKLLVPVTLYFHNDEPDKKTLATKTSKNYKTTFDEYVFMKELYKKEFSKGKKGQDLNRAHKEIDILFDDSIAGGMKNLEQFTETLLNLVKEGKQVTITIKGYCSPLASTKYNTHLAKRRISSLKNYFIKYNNGELLPYINPKDKSKGAIYFSEVEIGELKAKPHVSDSQYDTINSIYNPDAALERKIQIIAVTIK